MAIHITRLNGGNIIIGSGGHPGPIVNPETYIKFSDGTEFNNVIEFPDGLNGIFDLRTAVKYGWTAEGSDGYDGSPGWNIKDPVEAVLGSNVTSIGDYAFYSCSGLTSVTMPDSVTSIGVEAFDGCSALTNMTIGSGVTSIDDNAFFVCENLRNITFSGKTKATVQGMANYSWNLPTGCILHCTDGDITL